MSKQEGNLNRAGNPGAPILIITDAPGKHAYDTGQVMSAHQMKLIQRTATANGIPGNQFRMVTPCPPIPDEISTSERKIGDFLALHRQELLEELEDAADCTRLIITLGKVALRQLMGKQVKITEARGSMTTCAASPDVAVLPLLSPAHVLRRPEMFPIFEGDFKQIPSLRDADWDASIFETLTDEADYEWCLDLSPLLKNRPSIMTVDTETRGLEWRNGRRAILCVQITTEVGHAYVVPLDRAYFNDPTLRGNTTKGLRQLTDKCIEKLVLQLKDLCGDPNIRVAGHNLKYDIHHLLNYGIEIANWAIDTMQLTFAVDDNMQLKNLDECIRRWVPEMAGYADCVTPSTEILTYDMRKVCAGDLRVGDDLCAFTAETNGKKAHRRKMSRSTVLGVQRLERECLMITTESGKVTEVSTGHLMLCKRGLSDKGGGWRWRRADSLTVGSVLKPFAWEDPLTDFDAGYVSGVIDGEGWIHSGRARLGVAQRENPVLRKFKEVVLREGMEWGHSTDHRNAVNVVNVTFDGHACFEMLQKFRPVRLLESASWEGCGLPTNGNTHDRIVSIESTGVKEVIGLKTSTQTIIADGLLSHNSFNAETDKANMHLVPHDRMLRYAGGDTDATYRLATVLTKIAKEDRKNFNCFQRVQMPALRSFVGMERAGISMDKEALRALGILFAKTEKELYAELIGIAVKKAPQVCRKYAESPEGLKFTAAFLIELLFTSPDGYKLTPRVWTDTTRRLPMEQRIPSTSANVHLPFFEHIGFVSKLIRYKKLQKMRTSYVGDEGGIVYQKIERLKNGKLPLAAERIITASGRAVEFANVLEKQIPMTPAAAPKSIPVRRRSIVTPANAPKPLPELNRPVGEVHQISTKLSIDDEGTVWKTSLEEPSGFWQHLIGGNIMNPFFRLDNTVTGRSSSNLQNIPKRDPIMAKAFRKCFVARPGNALIECDLSQAELRIMAWASNEKNMIRIYKAGGDIHISTAAGVKGISPKDVTKADRQGAKAVNFGLIYLMWWRALIDYAKTTYQVTMTPTQAEAAYKGFFAMYPGVAAYHKATVKFVKENTYVRALHGALRRLPSINSDDEGIRKECERQSVNSPIQRFGSDIGLMGLARFDRDCPKDIMWPVAFIHDAVVIECKEEYAEEVAASIRFYMQSIPFEDWFGIRPPIPITADVSIGFNLADMTERPDIEAVAPEWYCAEADYDAA